MPILRAKFDKMEKGKMVTEDQKDLLCCHNNKAANNILGGGSFSSARRRPPAGRKEVPWVVIAYLQIINYYQGMIDARKLSGAADAHGRGHRIQKRELYHGAPGFDGLAQAGYLQSAQEGQLCRIQRRRMQLNHLIGFSDEMRSLGLEPSTILVEMRA